METATLHLRETEIAFLSFRKARLEHGLAYRGVPESVAAQRLETCYGCSSCIDTQDLCVECGCNVKMKRWVPWWFCKLGKFDAVT